MLSRVALLSFLGAVLVLAQEPALTIRTSTRLVELTVVVQDDKGQPVTNLTKDDFTITDDGKRQSISVFEAENGAEVRNAATLPAGHYSNRLEYRGGAPQSATVLLIDMINTPPGYWGRAKPHLAKFLARSDPKLRLAIYALNRSGLRILHDFTSVADQLPQGMSEDTRAFMTSVGNPAGATAAIMGSGSGYDAMAALIAWSEAVEGAFERPLAGLQTAEALASIAQRLSAVPGRKNLVWVTTGFTRASDGGIGRVADAFDRATRSLSNASVAVYPVDVRGLLALTDSLRDVDTTNMPFGRKKAVRWEMGPTPGAVTMEELAGRTGGRVFHGEEIDEALPAVFSHARSFYLLGYYPSSSDTDGKFHPIRVRLRQGGLKVSHRGGYYTLPAGEPNSDQRKAELISAVWAPVDATAVPFEAATDGKTLTLAISGRGLLFDRRDDKLACRMDLLVVQLNGENKQIESTLDVFEAAATPEKAQAVVANGLTHRKELQLKPETKSLRVVLRNRAGALGSVSVPLIQYRP